ncbi:MAG: endolytic transglycosylase MltG [Gemmatimonadota bacterium]
MRRLLVLFVVAALAAAAGVSAWVWNAYEKALPMPGERVEFRIAPGASTRAIARQLQAAGIDINETLFVIAARATRVTQSLRAGRYEILRGASLHQLLDKLRAGDTLRERITLIEGWTLRDLRAALAADPDLRHDSAAMSESDLLKAIGAGEARAEGLFAPDTYVFESGTSDLDLLRRAYRAQAATLQRAWESRAAGLPYESPYQALIMASIVEKETGQTDERRRIAGVFVNRLQKGMPLQTDPTVIYGLGGQFDGNLRKRDLVADGPYNTYTRTGLPPTPIALPGRASIEAALQPQPTRDLYFVARGDGTSEFSETLEKHNRAVAKYQLGAKR